MRQLEVRVVRGGRAESESGRRDWLRHSWLNKQQLIISLHHSLVYLVYNTCSLQQQHDEWYVLRYRGETPAREASPNPVPLLTPHPHPTYALLVLSCYKLRRFYLYLFLLQTSKVQSSAKQLRLDRFRQFPSLKLCTQHQPLNWFSRFFLMLKYVLHWDVVVYTYNPDFEIRPPRPNLLSSK